MPLPMTAFLAGSAFMYLIGMYCLATKRNIIRQIIAIEILVNAAHLNFVAFSANLTTGYVDPSAQSIVAISIAIGAAVVAVALLIVIAVYRIYGTLDTAKLKRLRW